MESAKKEIKQALLKTDININTEIEMNFLASILFKIDFESLKRTLKEV
jgi:hypothetical protein